MPLTQVSPCKHHDAGMHLVDTLCQGMTVAWAVGTHLARHVSCMHLLDTLCQGMTVAWQAMSVAPPTHI